MPKSGNPFRKMLASYIEFKPPIDISMLDSVQYLTKEFASKFDTYYDLRVGGDPSNNFKDTSKSIEYRNEGNIAYENEEYIKSINFYDMSISKAEAGTPEIALAFANRSAVLFAMGKFNECIADIKQAQESGYPEYLKYKLLLREGQCYRDLGQSEEASDCFEFAIHALKRTELSQKKRENIKARILEEKKKGMTEITESYVCCTPELPTLSYDQSEEIPCASNALGLRYDEKFGRHFEATKDIKVGDVLMIETPHTVSTFPVTYSTDKDPHCCTHCQKISFTLLPCPDCAWAMFCSTECLETARDQYHKTECVPFSRYIAIESENTFLHVSIAMRLIAKVGIENLKKLTPYVPLASDDEAKRTRSFNADGKHDMFDFKSVFNLENNFSKLVERNAKFDVCMVAIAMSKCFNPDGYLDDHVLTTLILQIYLICKYNLLSITFPLLDSKTNTVKFIVPSCGIYSVTSYFNHSCHPNTTLILYDNKAVIRASQPITKGEQVFVKYELGWPLKHNKLDRQQSLKENFQFDCNCEACDYNWPPSNQLTSYCLTSNFKDLPKHIANEIHGLVSESLKDYYHLENLIFQNRKSLAKFCEEKNKLNCLLLTAIHKFHDKIPSSEFTTLKMIIYNYYSFTGTVYI